ncbi:MAG: HD domain-containing protein, partial [Flavobacteriales bacterium]|nr:HD domain-containing protein [Flavobacteriales bacterium]MDW8410994.1 HD domain-containing protein [Flavobacteriales bacterium]
MSASITRDLLYLAALLHDIGKFYQRADENPASQSHKISKEIKNLEDFYCPRHPNGYRTHKHVLWTAQFFEDHKEFFCRLLGNTSSYEQLKNTAARHHNVSPGALWEVILQKADHWASGADRTQEEGQKDAQHEGEAEKSWDSFKKVRMRSLFESLFRESKSFPYTWHLPVAPLQLDAAFFPTQEEESPNYEALWDDFQKEVRILTQRFKHSSSQRLRFFAESLLPLLHKYLVTVPSST